MKNRLIIVEGLPCSGKSTTSAHIARLLTEMGKRVIFIDEGSGHHPADYEFQSYITSSILEGFRTEEKAEILTVSKQINDGYIVELSELSPDTFKKVLPYKIYDFLDWETERDLLLDKWREFAAEADVDTIYVFNCCFLQNPMCETMIRFGFDAGVSEGYIRSIADIIKPFQPLCIYLKPDNYQEKIQSALGERGGEWLESVIDYHTNGVYGVQHGLKGFDGYIACLEERCRREVLILQKLEMDHLIVEQNDNDWKGTYRQIDNCLAG